MKNPFVYGVGGVLSADIAVPDHERELAFYSKILTTGDAPLWRDDLMNNFGTPIIGLGRRTPEYDALPLQWMPHFQVADVAQSADRAVELGGKEIMRSDPSDSQNQWAGLIDRDGAGFGIISVVAEPSDQPPPTQSSGCIAWLSLTASDAVSSRDFYQRVIGWNANPVDVDGDEGSGLKFEMQIDENTIAAEICQANDEQNRIPPVWLIHLPVGDLAESLRRVSESGGEVVVEIADAKRAIIRDPVGVYFALQAVSTDV